MKMDPKIEARQLLDDYNLWRMQTSSIIKKRSEGAFINFFKSNPERIELLQETAIWCRSKGIDPRLWIYLLFRARKWMFSPQLNKSHLMSEKMAERYPDISVTALDGYRKYIQIQSGKDDLPFDPNWEISPGAEAVKRTYASYNDYARCMRESLDTTLGYHPKSPTCISCPLANDCSNQLRKLIPEFDIVALRAGKITPAQAKAAVSND